jgi:hypothetical protein
MVIQLSFIYDGMIRYTFFLLSAIFGNDAFLFKRKRIAL